MKRKKEEKYISASNIPTAISTFDYVLRCHEKRLEEMEKKIKTVDQLEKKINSFQKTIDQQNKTIAEQEAIISTQKSRIDGFSTAVTVKFKQVLEVGISSLKTSVETRMKQEVDKLNDTIAKEVNSFMGELDKEEAKRESSKIELIALKSQVSDGINTMNNMKKQVDKEIKVLVPSINSVSMKVDNLENKISDNSVFEIIGADQKRFKFTGPQDIFSSFFKIFKLFTDNVRNLAQDFNNNKNWQTELDAWNQKVDQRLREVQSSVAKVTKSVKRLENRSIEIRSNLQPTSSNTSNGNSTSLSNSSETNKVMPRVARHLQPFTHPYSVQQNTNNVNNIYNSSIYSGPTTMNSTITANSLPPTGMKIFPVPTLPTNNHSMDRLDEALKLVGGTCSNAKKDSTQQEQQKDQHQTEQLDNDNYIPPTPRNDYNTDFSKK